MVLVVAAILAGAMAVFVTRAMEGFRDLGRRATLVDVAEGALRRIARDGRRALPNSVRVGGAGRVLEMLHATDGGRYRRRPGTNPGPVSHTDPSDWLTFSAAGDSQFNLLGRLPALAFGYGTPLPTGTRLAVYPTGSGVYSDGASGANPGVITPVTTQITIVDDTDEDQFLLSTPFQFRLESPRQRLYVVDTPITYSCDLTNETVTRRWAYAITSTQPTDPAVAPLSGAESALVTNRVTACSFAYQPGTSQRAGLLTMEIQLSEAGEQVRVLHQVQVENTP